MWYYINNKKLKFYVDGAYICFLELGKLVQN